jgi:predicted ester cyclase
VSVEENKAIVRRFIQEVMSDHDLSKIDAYVAPEAGNHSRTGTNNYRTALRGVFSQDDVDWKFEVDDIIAEDDRVVVRCTASYTVWIEQNKLGIRYRPGTRATVWHVHIFRLRDGLIVDHWPVRDDWDAVVQFNAPLAEAGRATST